MTTIKADLHIHTTFSADSEITPEKLVARVQEIGLGCVAVTDHNTAEGSFKVRDLNPPFIVITAEEILTTEGEIIGLFLNQSIPRGLSPEEAIARIHAQGGLAYVPHPFDHFRSSALQGKTLERIIGSVDCIEASNARTVPLQDLSRPQELAEKYGKPMGAGSDSHSFEEVGRSYVEMETFAGPEEFLQALRSGKIHRYEASKIAYASDMGGRFLRKIIRGH